MSGDAHLLRIGEVATRLAISTRTLRYYEELGLLDPAGRTPGGGRRYGDDDVERVRHIRDLQQVLGFNLDEIKEIIDAEDRLAELRTEYRKSASVRRQESILHEAFALNERLQRHVSAKIGVLDGFMAELKAKARRYEEVAAERGLRLPERPAAPRRIRQ
jgi:DNA-binding transcriptional MerR regulator